MKGVWVYLIIPMCNTLNLQHVQSILINTCSSDGISLITSLIIQEVGRKFSLGWLYRSNWLLFWWCHDTQSNNQQDRVSTENKKVTGTIQQAALNRNLNYSPEDMPGVPQISLLTLVCEQEYRCMKEPVA